LIVRLNQSSGQSKKGRVCVASTSGFRPIETAAGYRIRLDVDRLVNEIEERSAKNEDEKQSADEGNPTDVKG